MIRHHRIDFRNFLLSIQGSSEQKKNTRTNETKLKRIMRPHFWHPVRFLIKIVIHFPDHVLFLTNNSSAISMKYAPIPILLISKRSRDNNNAVFIIHITSGRSSTAFRENTICIGCECECECSRCVLNER